MPNTYILACFDNLTWTEGIRTNPTYFNVSHQINLNGSFHSNQFILEVNQLIQLDSDPYGHYGLSNKSHQDSIQFRQDLRRNLYESVSQYINFTERFIIPKVQSITQTINFSQTYTQPGRLINESITLTDSIHYNTIRSITVTDQLTFNSSPTIIKLAYDFIQTNQITITPSQTISFISTNLIPTKTLTIKAPDFEDTDELHFNKVQHNTRNNDLIIFKDPMWPAYEIFNLHFSFLSQNDIYALIDFINAIIGQDVIYNDFEGQQWIGIITNPIGEIVQPGRFNHHAHIVFEGNVVSYGNVTHNVNLHQTVSHT